MKVLKLNSNKKLGKSASMSRPVGPTCPRSCPFMTGKIVNGQGDIVDRIPEQFRCYANKGACSWPSTRACWEKNLQVDPSALGADLAHCARKGIPVRFHVGGDFGRDSTDRIDRPYLAGILRAFRICRDKVGQVPAAWVYTHFWRSLGAHRKYLARFLQVFASVHTAEERQGAADLGYRLAVDLALEVSSTCSRVSLKSSDLSEIKSALVCPEQRLGADRITCASCGYCARAPRNGQGDVAFIRH